MFRRVIFLFATSVSFLKFSTITRPFTPLSFLTSLTITRHWNHSYNQQAHYQTISSLFSEHACMRPSAVCRLSVTFVRPTRAIEIFGNVSMPFRTLAICWLLQCESKKVAPPLKLLAIFSLRLSIFLRNFASLLPVHIHTCLPVSVDLT